jgi:hypothetical protein
MTIRNRIRTTTTLVLLALLSSSQPFAQQPNPSALTLERIFSSREFVAERFGPARWLEGGAAYTTVEASPTSKGADDLIRYDSATGQRSALVAAEQLIPKGQTTPLQIEDYDWSADGKRLLIFTNTVKVWRYNTRGDYWVLDRATKSLTKLGGDGAASSLMFAKFSPDGTRGRLACGRVGLERWRFDDFEFAVSFARNLQSRNVRRAGQQSTVVRHNLSGTLHGLATGQRRRLQAWLASDVCR